MPYIIGHVTQLSAGGNPCLDFQVTCTNKPYINPVIAHFPPYFWVTVPKDEYVIEISTPAGVTNAVASALSDFGGVSLNIAAP